MEIRFVTKEFDEALKALAPKQIRKVAKSALRGGANIITKAARKNLKAVAPTSKERRAANKAAGIKNKEQGIVTHVKKTGELAVSRVWRSKKRTGQPHLDKAYLLRILEKGAAAGGTRDRYTSAKNRAAYASKNRGRISPKPFFEPAKEATEGKAFEYVKNKVLEEIEKVWKK